MKKKLYKIPKTEKGEMLLHIPACSVTASADGDSIVLEDPEELSKEHLPESEEPNTAKWGSLW